jgi:hypothetical protein
MEFQIRSIILCQGINFRYGQQEQLLWLWLTVMQDMLHESLTLPGLNETAVFENIRAHLRSTSGFCS